MYLRSVILLCGLQIAVIYADFQAQNQNQFQGGGGGGVGFVPGGFNQGGFNQGGFNQGPGFVDQGPGFNSGFQQPVPFGSQTSQFANKQLQTQNAAQGNSAAAGNANALGLGSASSINQAQHQADQGRTMANSLSANTASGTLGSSAGGAAQAGGQVQNSKQLGLSTGFQNTGFVGGFRRKRGIYGGFGDFGWPSNSNANANSIGGGSANWGRVSTNNNAFSRTDPNSAMGFGAGNSFGEGQGVNIFQATNTNAASGNFGRR